VDCVEVTVLSIVPSPHGNSLILSDEEGGRVLPVVINVAEALAIYFHLTDQKFDRPMSHDLLAAVVERLGGRVTSITVTDLVDGTFHAAVNIVQEGQEKSIDARSSDAIALGVRVGVPLYVARHVMDEAGQSMTTGSSDSDDDEALWTPDPFNDDDQDVDRFRDIMRDAGLDEA